MPTPTRVGSVAVQPQSLEFSWDPRNFFKPVNPLYGPLGIMLQESALLRAYRIAHHFRQDGPNAEITLEGGGTVDIGQTEVPADDWELVNGEIQRDILQAPFALAMAAAVTGILGATVFDVQNQQQNNPSIINNGKQQPDGFTVPQAQNASQIQLGALLMSNETHYPVDAPVLRHTQTVSDSWTDPGGVINRGNLRLVYPTSLLLTEIATFAFPCPLILQQAIQSAQDASEPLPAGPPTYIKGWQKKITSQGTAARYKVKIVTEYVWGQYASPPFSLATQINDVSQG